MFELKGLMMIMANDIKLLGTSGSKTDKCGASSILVSKNIAIDAGNIINSMQNRAQDIEHIFLTHSHLDHISDIPYMIDTFFAKMDKPLKIYALKETIQTLNNHMFNWKIWPDFQNIQLLNSKHNAVEFIEISYKQEYKFDEVSIKAIPLNHVVPTCGFVIKKKSFSTIYAPDTYICDSIWQEANKDHTINSIIIDVSFPSRLDKLAKDSKHLTPKLLKQELKKLKRDDVSIFVTHIKPNYFDEVVYELEKYSIFKNNGRVLKDNEFLINHNYMEHDNNYVDIITAISKEKDLGTILQIILTEAMKFTHSEGGTIYLKEKDKLIFKVVKNTKLEIFDTDVNWSPVKLYIDGKENTSNVSALCALKKEVIKIDDAYEIKEFDFQGMREFDKANNYHSKSMLVVPMMDHEDELIGVLQLLNKKDLNTTIAYTQKDIDITLAYGAYSAVAITKNRLIDSLENLLLAFLKSIAVAINAKSSYGYGHIERVAALMDMITDKIHNDNTIYKDIRYSDDELSELSLAAWMHDIGKIATPEYVLNKATKLETIHDRISEIKIRFENAKNLLKIQMLETKYESIKKRLQKEIDELEKDYLFLEKCNQPENFLKDEDIKKIQAIAKKTYLHDNKPTPLLSANEVENLSIRSGSLTEEERLKINEHAKVSFDMLSSFEFPKKFKNVPQIASSHHEKLNGTGYPRGLSADEISLKARMLIIADIFEALTANDRPYKTPKTLKEAYKILSFMVKDGELDGELLEFLKKSGVFKEYAKQYLNQEQLVE